MLSVSRLRAGYGPLEVLHDVSLEINTGDAVAVLGANGAGKTTLMRALTGLIRTRAGSINLDGRRLDRLPPERRVSDGLALAPEGRELFNSLTVRENLLMGAFTRRDRHALADDIEQALMYFPRLRQRLDAPAASLSGGEGQMLSISRALMSRPNILLLDEPSLGLAPSVVNTVFEVIARLNREQGLTVVLVEQNAQMALSIVSAAYVLQGGSVALHGTTADLARNPSIRSLYLGIDESETQSQRAPLESDRNNVEDSMSSSLLDSIRARTVDTARLSTHVLTSGDETGIPVVFIHGNVSSARFFEETMLALPDEYWGVAPDLRGFGDSQVKPVDATRGVRDFSDDLHALFETLGVIGQRRPHLVGWSMGGGVAIQYMIDHPGAVASLTLIDPMSPFGFGGTKDSAGALCWPDGAGSGGGTANSEFVQRLKDKDAGSDSPNSPRNVMNAFYFKPPFKTSPEREDLYVAEMLKMATGDGNYPGELSASENWPNVKPGLRGVNNAIGAGYCDLSPFGVTQQTAPVLWMRGADDQIVSDTSFLDFGTLGSLGYVPGWPGAEIFPSQPMVSQMRAVLDRYQSGGGQYDEVIVADCGHSPHIEKPEEFRKTFLAFLARNGQ